MDQAMIIAGIGCRKATSAADIEALITAALTLTGFTRDALDLVATSAEKGTEAGIAAAASALGVPLVIVPGADLAAAGTRTVTRSERVLALAGVPSVAEAAALAAGGDTAWLIAPRIALNGATCALAECGGKP
jgi:cobalt-precorrin 5A hydrolase